jgi:iron complex outermembrane receptor protein
MSTCRYSFKATCAVGAWAVIATSPVIAQESAQLEEVVVTAQKRTENLQQTPVAVTALSTDTLAQRNIQTTQDLMQVTPGLQVSTQTAGDVGGSATFFLRGMGQQRSGNGQEPAVGVYIDDIYYPSLEGTIFNIIDLSQVEVLRGPQGTLFGRNTIGGAIRYTTQKPTDDFSASATVTGGSFGRNDYTGTLNVPVGDIIEIRFTAGRLKTDGYVREQDGAPDAGGSQTSLGRLAIRAKPTSDLTIDLTAQYSRQYLDGFPYEMPGPIIPGPLFPSWWNLNPTHAGQLYGNQYASQCVYCQAGTGEREFSDTRTPNGTLVVNWNPAGDLAIKSLTGWTKVENSNYSDQDGSPLPLFEANLNSVDTAVSEELQVNDKSFGGRLDWVGGLYYYHERLVQANSTQTEALPPPGPGIPLQVVGRGTVLPQPEATRLTDSYAAYLNGSYHLFDKFSLLGGFRYSDDDKHVTTVGFAPAHASFSSNTWRAGVQYQWTDDIMTYATASTGFRAGGFNPAGGTPPVPFIAFQPEYDRSYELGARMDFLDQRVRVNPTVFYNNWTGIQVQSAVPVIGEGLVLELQNAGRAHTYGAELEAEAKVAPHLLVFGNLATLTAHYDSIGSASGITLDSHFERAPTLTYALGTTYDHDVASNVTLRGTVNWSWEARQNSTPTDADTLSLPSYGLLNARLECIAGTHWTVAAFGTNLTNRVYYVGGVNYSDNVGSAHYDLGRPREFGVSARYNF